VEVQAVGGLGDWGIQLAKAMATNRTAKRPPLPGGDRGGWHGVGGLWGWSAARPRRRLCHDDPFSGSTATAEGSGIAALADDAAA
jgi:hypothetical protein